MRNPPSCQLQTSEGDGRGREGGDREEGVWIRRLTPTDLHLPPPPRAPSSRRSSRSSPRRGSGGPGSRASPGAHPAGKQDAAGGYVRASPRTAASTPRPGPPLGSGKGEGAAGRAPKLPEASAACVEPSSSGLRASPQTERGSQHVFILGHCMPEGVREGSREPLLFFRGEDGRRIAPTY